MPDIQLVQKVVKCSPWLAQPLRSHEHIQTQWFVWSLACQLSLSLDGAEGLSCANSAGLDVQEEGGCGVGYVCGWRRYAHFHSTCCDLTPLGACVLKDEMDAGISTFYLGKLSPCPGHTTFHCVQMLLKCCWWGQSRIKSCFCLLSAGYCFFPTSKFK